MAHYHFGSSAAALLSSVLLVHLLLAQTSSGNQATATPTIYYSLYWQNSSFPNPPSFRGGVYAYDVGSASNSTVVEGAGAFLQVAAENGTLVYWWQDEYDEFGTASLYKWSANQAGPVLLTTVATAPTYMRLVNSQVYFTALPATGVAALNLASPHSTPRYFFDDQVIDGGVAVDPLSSTVYAVAGTATSSLAYLLMAQQPGGSSSYRKTAIAGVPQALEVDSTVGMLFYILQQPMAALFASDLSGQHGAVLLKGGGYNFGTVLAADRASGQLYWQSGMPSDMPPTPQASISRCSYSGANVTKVVRLCPAGSPATALGFALL